MTTNHKLTITITSEKGFRLGQRFYINNVDFQVGDEVTVDCSHFNTTSIKLDNGSSYAVIGSFKSTLSQTTGLGQLSKQKAP